MLRITGTPLVWGIIALAIYLVYKEPATMSSLVGDLFHAAAGLGDAIGRFLVDLTQ
jgi:hypothetical protein